MLFCLSIYWLYPSPVKKDNTEWLLSFSWFVYLQLNVYKNVNGTCPNFEKIPQSWSLSLPKTEIYCPYALIKLNYKVFSFHLMPDLWDKTHVVSDLSLLSRGDLRIMRYREVNGTMSTFLWIILDLTFQCGYFSLQGSVTDDLCSLIINEKTECSHQC